MKLAVVCAPFQVTLDAVENCRQMVEILEQCEPNDVVVFPEASLSGYSDDINFLAAIDQQEVTNGLDLLQGAARANHQHLFVGACRPDHEGWHNQAYYLGPTGQRAVYNKVNLATHERGFMVPGDSLPVFDLEFPEGNLRVGIQLCRELRFPDQWRALAEAGAELIVYMTYAIGDEAHRPVWRAHLVSRAAENQRWVAAVNVAHRTQLCPSMLIDPAGLVIHELVSEFAPSKRAEIDTNVVSDWYLTQRRTDLTPRER
ncbi:MAG: carbon-nitrogen hydrolase family protein [Ferrimicrobium sp.]|uniref:Carbon-nitrogen hydrolase family protein n=1 Tax=Ferrimicrobium acidiphilum TaxID=121039 RepID=A0ABV3Y776_9ACTN|nr:carbon-nitrogen hydrolase family protein [Ferrimicrobium sp.]